MWFKKHAATIIIYLLFIFLVADKYLPAKIKADENDLPGMIGSLKNPSGGSIELFEVKKLPKDIYCIIAVSSTMQAPSLYPNLVCVKR